jgi:2-dehydro-3-deoxygluconokinase
MVERAIWGMNLDLNCHYFPMSVFCVPRVCSTFTVQSPTPGLKHKVIYDRDNEAAQWLEPKHHDWDSIMQNSRLFHTGGIFATLNRKTTALVLHAFEKAQEHGVPRSFDPNWRNFLVDHRCAVDGCTVDDVRAFLTEIASRSTILTTNVDDPMNAFGISGPDPKKEDIFSEKHYPDSYKEMILALAEKFPDARVITMQLRKEITPTEHKWSAIAYATESRTWALAPRVAFEYYPYRTGGGDAYAGGFLGSFLLMKKLQECVDIGWAHGAVVAKLPSDASQATMDDVRGFIGGTDLAVQR